MTEVMGRPAPVSAKPSMEEIHERLLKIADRYPPEQIEHQRMDSRRAAEHVYFVVERVGPDARLCDIGGGLGVYPLGCTNVGMTVTLVDDFNDDANRRNPLDKVGLHEPMGVRVVSSDALDPGLDFPDGSFDAVTTFDSLEHWHHSPRRLFRNVARWLRPGGLFLLGVPNRHNLRKRVATPFGVGSWSPLAEWYEPDTFRGHVREPTVAELRWMAADMGLERIEVWGRNWLGLANPRASVRALAAVIDKPLRTFPTLCADIYVAGRKPGG